MELVVPSGHIVWSLYLPFCRISIVQINLHESIHWLQFPSFSLSDGLSILPDIPAAICRGGQYILKVVICQTLQP